MSIALERGGGGPAAGGPAAGGGIIRGVSWSPIRESPPDAAGAPPEERMESDTRDSLIGRDSCCSTTGADGDDDSGEAEVQSTLKGALDTMDSLHASLPVGQNISKFYCSETARPMPYFGRELAKQNTPKTWKRKNLLASSTFNDSAGSHDNLLRESPPDSLSSSSAEEDHADPESFCTHKRTKFFAPGTMHDCVGFPGNHLSGTEGEDIGITRRRATSKSSYNVASSASLSGSKNGSRHGPIQLSPLQSCVKPIGTTSVTATPLSFLVESLSLNGSEGTGPSKLHD